jgi:hypothetical protein
MNTNETPLDPFHLGLDTIETARNRDIPLRLFGGQAVRYLTPQFPPRIRSDQDVDFATISARTDQVIKLLRELGYHADDRFNALHGHRQLYFVTPDTRASVDVVIDKLSMCHELSFADRMHRNPVTIDVTDLLLSKLQIVELNEKDIQDIIYLLSAYEVRTSEDVDSIALTRIGDIVASDWGWWRTVTGSLNTLSSLPNDTWQDLLPPSPPIDARESVRAILQWTEDVPKSGRWRVRNRLGDRMKWYETPEEETH